MQVDFYIVASNAPQATLRTACRVAEKAWQMGHRIYIHTDSADVARSMDDLLWSFRQESFVPHALWSEHSGQSATDSEPILVGDGGTPEFDVDVLINLAEAVPLFVDNSSRIAEIVGAGEAERRAGRDRYRSYRERGYDIRQHDV